MADFARAMAHDLNNLLATIAINAELIRDDRGSREQTSGTILKATERGKGITRRLFAFSGQRDLSPARLSVADFLESMKAPIAEVLGADIEMRVALPLTHWPVCADPAGLRQALLELARNARDAMPASGCFTLEATQTSVAARDPAAHDDLKPGDYVVLRAADTGSGMPEEVLERACEPLFTTKGAGRNPGLGLSSVYGYIRQTGGGIAIDSVVGEGTSVSLLLPRAGEDESKSADGEDTQVRRRSDGAGASVLVVEDDDDLRSLIVQFLSASGFDAVAAGDGETALAAMEARGVPFDLVLSDVILVGGMSGPAFVEAAQARGWPMKVLYMSGYPQFIERGQTSLLEDAAIIAKPFRRAELIARIREVLREEPE